MHPLAKHIAVWGLILAQSSLCCCGAMREPSGRQQAPCRTQCRSCCRMARYSGKSSCFFRQSSSSHRELGTTCCECRQPRTNPSRSYGEFVREILSQASLFVCASDFSSSYANDCTATSQPNDAFPFDREKYRAVLGVWLK